MTHGIRHVSLFLSLLLVVLVGGTGGCALFSDSTLPPPPDPGPMSAEPYVIGAGDNLQIAVWKNPELSARVVVRPDGKISVPLADDVQAAGLTPLELKEVITRSLQEYIVEPDVTVLVTAINSKRIFLMGEGVRSAAVPLDKDMRILDALAAVGGFREFADKKNIRILRENGDAIEEYKFNYEAFVDGHSSPEANMRLRPGDTIVVP